MTVTRRHFLTQVAAAGSVSLAYEAMTGLGLVAAPAQQTRFELSGRVSGVRVVILGGGLAGLTAAYELGKVGYDCRVLEAGHAHSPAVPDRVRDRVFRLVAARAVEPRVLAVRVARGTPGARAAAAARRPRAFRR